MWNDDESDDESEVTCDVLKFDHMYPWMSGWTKDQFIEYNHNINAPIDQATLYNYITTMYNKYGPVIFDHPDTINVVCSDLSLLKFAHSNRAFDSTRAGLVCTYVAYTGNIDCLRFAHEHGYPWDDNTLSACLYIYCDAIDNDNTPSNYDPFQCFTYALENGCDWSPRIYIHHPLNIIKYANEHGYPWPEDITLDYALTSRTIELIYAYENGQPWHPDVCTLLAADGDISTLKYATEHGCPFDRNLFMQCVANLENPAIKKRAFKRQVTGKVTNDIVSAPDQIDNQVWLIVCECMRNPELVDQLTTMLYM